MRAVISANGEMTSHPRLRALWQQADLRIAADGGAGRARLWLGPAPHVIIGDMDSVDDETRAWLAQNRVEQIHYPPAKDATDLELALDLASERGAQETLILGAFGGRADQFIANVLLLARAPQARIADGASEIWAARARAEIQGSAGDTVSLLPLSDRVEGILTTDLEYPLRRETLTLGSTRGVSNVMLGDSARIEWQTGILLIIHLFQQPAP